MNHGFVEPRAPAAAIEDPPPPEQQLGRAALSASTPKLARRHSESQPKNNGLFEASPLIQTFQNTRIRAISTSDMMDCGSPQAFVLNNLSQSLVNDSGINECSFNIAAPPKINTVRSLNKDFFNETPPGILYDDENAQPLPLSDDEEEEGEPEKENCNKRGLTDSYLAMAELSPSVPQLKRPSSEHLQLPVVPGCLDSSYDKPPLIGDNSREYLLPYNACNSEHCDLKCISADTLAGLMQGRFSETVESYLIIDTRYPYEFEGGHIEGAVNVVTREDMTRIYLDNPDIPSKRQVVIFHCEFSSKRGPRMCRFVRKEDRDRNSYRYPSLYYPELYILHGGYKEFYPLYPDLCKPQNYVLMADPNFAEQLNHWQKICKTHTDSNGTTTVRGFKSRVRSQRQLNLP